MKHNPQIFLDKLAISVSAICAVHCLLTPILLTLLPIVSLNEIDEHVFHMMLIWLIIPSSFIAATLGCGKHKDKWVLFGISIGLFTLIFAAMLGHDLVGELGEKLMTLLATTVLALSHWRNFNLCKNDSCKHSKT